MECVISGQLEVIVDITRPFDLRPRTILVTLFRWQYVVLSHVHDHHVSRKMLRVPEYMMLPVRSLGLLLLVCCLRN